MRRWWPFGGKKRRSAAKDKVVEETKEANVVTNKNAKDITRVNQYKIEKKLGAGAFGAVYEALDQNQESVAIKVMDKGELRKKSRGLGKRPMGPKGGASGDASGATVVSDTILREIATMKRVQHPNCVRLFEVIDDPIGDRMFLVMEYLNGGEVLVPKNLPDGKDFLDEENAREVFRDLLDGLEYLHGNGILHRDIKPENMVYYEKPNFKVPYGKSRTITSLGGGSVGAVLHAGANVVQAGANVVHAGANVGANVVHAGANVVQAGANVGANVVHAGANVVDSLTGIHLPGTPRAGAPMADAAAPSGSDEEHAAARKLQAGVRGRNTRKKLEVGAPEEHAAASKLQAGFRGRNTRKKISTAAEPAFVRQLPPVKLLDFGISQVCVNAHDLDLDESHVKKGFDDTILKATGTPPFYAPEMVALPPKPFHGRPADVWAAGVTLCMLVTGKLPFEADNMPEIWRKIKEEAPVLPPTLSAPLSAMLRAMLAKRPEDRPTVQALRQYGWVTKEGADPMGEQPYLPLEITDDDIRAAVKNFSNTFTILKAGKKWMKAAQASAAARAEGEAADGASPVAVPEVSSPPPSANAKQGRIGGLRASLRFLSSSPKKQSSVIEAKPMTVQVTQAAGSPTKAGSAKSSKSGSPITNTFDQNDRL